MTVAVAREKMAREAAQLEASTQAEHAAVAQAQAQELYARMRQVRSLTRRLGQAVGSPCLGVCTHCDPISHDVCAISLAPAADHQSLRHPLRPPSLSQVEEMLQQSELRAQRAVDAAAQAEQAALEASARSAIDQAAHEEGELAAAAGSPGGGAAAA
eukprot:COSAG01_NODE_2872_length_6941_cov_31.436861_4_plen_157_part_00